MLAKEILGTCSNKEVNELTAFIELWDEKKQQMSIMPQNNLGQTPGVGG